MSLLTFKPPAANKTGLSAYKTVLANQDAIFKNLQTTDKGVGQMVSDQNAHILAGMNRLADRGSARVAKTVAKGNVRAKNLFGSAMGTVVKQDLLGATATAQGLDKTAHATAHAGQMTLKAGEVSRELEQQAVQAAKSSALYATTQLQVARQKAKEQKTTANLSTAQGSLLTLAQSGATYSQIYTDAVAMSSQYNLGPQAKAQLTGDYLTSLGYDPSDPTSTSSAATAAADGQVDQWGNPIPTSVDDPNATTPSGAPLKPGIQKDVITAVTSVPPTSLETLIANVRTSHPVSAYPPEFTQSIIDYTTKLYNAADAANKQVLSDNPDQGSASLDSHFSASLDSVATLYGANRALRDEDYATLAKAVGVSASDLKVPQKVVGTDSQGNPIYGPANAAEVKAAAWLKSHGYTIVPL